MKAIMVMFDSLNRHYLPNYGNQNISAPNFERLAQRTLTFDTFYAGSLPCMPARRELHTGRYNFLHRSWGPIEPFDDSLPEILKQNGIYTHLVSDHYHYWEDGGATYHNRYSSWEGIRGQEGDFWKARVKDPEIPPMLGRRNRQDWINREYIRREEDFPQTKTFDLGLEFIEQNHDEDNWFLQIETFDPHEPFFVPEYYAELYEDQYTGPHFDWPDYREVREDSGAIDHVRKRYQALVSMCDKSLGRVLDMMDRFDLWKDTLLIVNTDHGFLLAEHDWWAKCVQPFYNEIAHIPFFLYDPRYKDHSGERRKSLAQSVDIVPSIYEFFNLTVPDTVIGKSLVSVIKDDSEIRETALFGMHSGHINVTDGKYVYMRAPVDVENNPSYNYTLLPTHMRSMFSTDELQRAELSPPFSFSHGCPLLRIPAPEGAPGGETTQAPETMLFDLVHDPRQEQAINDKATEERLKKAIVAHLQEQDAPVELYKRYRL